jgi:glycosyltransferase involved in cell wall biosynthesis
LRYSDLIFAANSNYAKIAKTAVHGKVKVNRAFLGSSSTSTIVKSQDNSHTDLIKICYGGSLGNIYDFDLMFDGINQATQKGHNIEFWIIGGGDLEFELLEKSKLYTNFRTIITGKISYDHYLAKMSECQIGLNLFKPNELVSMSYKLYDYLACNLYVFNTLQGDAEEILHEFGVGSQVNIVNFATLLIDYLERKDFPVLEKFRKVNEQLNTVTIAKNIENLISYEKNILQSC